MSIIAPQTQHKTFRQKIISGHKFQSELVTDKYWLTVSRNMTLTLNVENLIVILIYGHKSTDSINLLGS
jgi:hypothetical protein